MAHSIPTRKALHLDVCVNEDVGFNGHGTLLDEVHLEHNAVPELEWHDLETSITLLGKSLRAPLIIGAMSGGTAEAGAMNAVLAEIAEELGIGFALGSQKAMAKDSTLADTFAVRRHAPTTLLLANVGAVYARQIGVEATRSLAAQVGADAIQLHLNAAMELVQGQGDRNFRGVLDTLRAVQSAELPVVAKETGSGLGGSAARALHAHGVRHVDVSGAGGTSWTAVESKLAEHLGDEESRLVGETFRNWGVPTAASIVHTACVGFDTVIATGGIQTGLDVARALALGANTASIARPVLVAYREGGAAAARNYLQRVLRELRMAMMLTASPTVAHLRVCPSVLGPELRRWTETADPHATR